MKTTIYIDDENGDETEVNVYGDYQPSEPSQYESGFPISPPIDASISFTGAETMDGETIELSKKDKQWAEEALWEVVGNTETEESLYD